MNVFIALKGTHFWFLFAQVCVDRLTDRTRNDLKSVEGSKNTNTTNRDQARNLK